LKNSVSDLPKLALKQLIKGESMPKEFPELVLKELVALTELVKKLHSSDA